MEYQILPYSLRKPHAVMKILNKIMIEEIIKKEKEFNLNSNKQINSDDKCKTVFLVSSVIPCSKCQFIIKELFLLMNKVISLIHPEFIPKKIHKKFICPLIITRKFYKNLVLRDKYKALIDIKSKLKKYYSKE